MKIKKTILILSLCSMVSLGFLNNLHAMPMHDPSDGVGSNCMLSDVSGDARGDSTACFSHGGNDVGAQGALLPHLNTGIFDGITTWSLVGEILGSQNSDVGSWTLSGGATTDGIVLSVKSSPEFRAYYLPGGILEGSGDWAVNDGQDLSHLTLAVFAQGPICPDPQNPLCGPANATPEPGTIVLMGSGLAGLGFWRWRKRPESQS